MKSSNNKDSGQAMDVMSGRSVATQSTPPAPQNNVMAPADDITQATNDPGMSYGSQKKSSRFGGKGIIFLVLIVAILLGTLLAGLLYLKSKDNQSADQDLTDNSQSITPTQEGKVSTSEIDSAITSIDKTLNTLNDSADFTPNDLSNSTLGLSN